jgi:hypothetical protein
MKKALKEFCGKRSVAQFSFSITTFASVGNKAFHSFIVTPAR